MSINRHGQNRARVSAPASARCVQFQMRRFGRRRDRSMARAGPVRTRLCTRTVRRARPDLGHQERDPGHVIDLRRHDRWRDDLVITLVWSGAQREVRLCRMRRNARVRWRPRGSRRGTQSRTPGSPRCRRRATNQKQDSDSHHDLPSTIHCVRPVTDRTRLRCSSRYDGGMFRRISFVAVVSVCTARLAGRPTPAQHWSLTVAPLASPASAASAQPQLTTSNVVSFSAGSSAPAPTRRSDSRSGPATAGPARTSPRGATGSSTGRMCRRWSASMTARSRRTGCRRAAPNVRVRCAALVLAR